MSYTALYRKFRPSSFDEVKGQDHIVKTFKFQFMADRLGHAYLFCGTRGTGKTSVAKIFARTVNCEKPTDGNPCNECRICRAITSGASMNVIEIDAASNNGVDNIREIREEVTYSPAEGKYKVYIIDEVHMLSTGAFNALLKTLEEPPSYVIFILATTESHKIPATILSRCQKYDFRRIGQETIQERMQELLAVEQVEAEERALRYIAKKGDGSLRDSLSLLDQCIAFYLGEALTYDRVLEVLGAVDTEVFSDLLRKILRNDLTAAIRTLEKLIMQGRDLTQFVSDFTWYLRNLMLMKASDDMEEVLDVSSENLMQLQEEASLVRNDTLMRYIRIFSELTNSIRYATNKRVQVEMALIKLCRPEMEKDELSLLERIRKLERNLQQGLAGYAAISQSMAGAEAGAFGGRMLPAGNPGSEPYGERAEGMPEIPAELRKPAPADLQRVCDQWRGIVSLMKPPFKNYLERSTPKYNATKEEDQQLYVVFPDAIAERSIGNPDRKAELVQAIADKTGCQVEVKFLLAEDEGIQRGMLSKIEDVSHVEAQLNGMEVENVD